MSADKERNIMKEKAFAQSKAFWSALEKADVDGMRAVADPKCMFVHIGVTCGMEEEMRCFTDKIFVPTKVVLNISRHRFSAIQPSLSQTPITVCFSGAKKPPIILP